MSGATYGGVSMTNITSKTGAYSKTYLFYLIAPATGANNVVVSVSGGYTQLAACSTSYSGASQSSQPDASASAASYTETLSVVNSGCWIVATTGFGQAQGAIYFTAGSGFTLRNSTTASYQECNGLQDSNGIVSTGSNTVAMSMTSGYNPDTIIAASILPSTAGRYWVGGTGTWDSSTSTHWSTTSGGTSGASAPTGGTDVYIDGNSGGGVITCSTSSSPSCATLDFTGFSGTFTNTNFIGTHGSIILSSTMTLTGTGTLRLAGTDSYTIRSNGNTFSNVIQSYTSGGGGTYSLVDTFRCKGTTFADITFNAFNNDSYIDTYGWYLNPYGNPVTLNMGSSTFHCKGAFTVDPSSVISPSTSVISMEEPSASTNAQFDGGGKTYNNLVIATTGAGAYVQILSANTFNVVTVNAGNTLQLTSSITQTVSDFISNGVIGNVAYLTASTPGTYATLSKSSGSVVVSNMSIRDNHAVGGASFTAHFSTNVSGNSGWSFTNDSTRSQSDSILRGASRSITLVKGVFRTLSDSITNSVSRFATVTRLSQNLRGLTVSILNSVSRLSVLSSVNSYKRVISDSIFRGASRITQVARGFFRSISDSIINGASRSATVSSLKVILKSLTDSIMNSASRLSSVSRILSSFRLLGDSITNAASRLISVSRVLNSVRLLSDLVVNAASRFTTIASIKVELRNLSDSMMNSASRFVSVLSIRQYARSLSDSISNAVSRLSTVSKLLSIGRFLTDSVMNSASRYTPVASIKTMYRTLSDSLINSVGRLTTVSLYYVLYRNISDGIMNGASRLTTLAFKIFGGFRPKVLLASVASVLKVKKGSTAITMSTTNIIQSNVKVVKQNDENAKIKVITNTNPKLKI